MSMLHLSGHPEDWRNRAQSVRVRGFWLGLTAALSLAGAVAGILGYRSVATVGKPGVAIPAPVAAPAVTNKPAVRQVTMRIEGNIELTITLDQPVPYDAHRLDHPDRVYVDLHGAHLGPELSRKTFFVNSGGVSNIRLALTQPDTVRAVVDLEKRFDYTIASQTNPAILVLELTPWAPTRSTRHAASSVSKKTSH